MLDAKIAIATYDLDGKPRHAEGITRPPIDGFPHHIASRTLPIGRSIKKAGLIPAAFWADLRRGIPHTQLAEKHHANGTPRWLEATYVPLTDGRGQVRQILKIDRDVTDRIAREHEQAERLRRLSLAADATDTAVLVSDSTGKVLYANGGFTRLFGWSEKEITGHSAQSFLQSGGTTPSANWFAPRCSLIAEREDLVTGKSGRRLWVKIAINTIAKDTGDLVYTVITLTDITNPKLHESLQRQALEAMAAERPLSEVLNLICEEVERIAPELTTSILEVDGDGHLHPLAAPSLPPSYSQSLEGMPMGPKAGSCGTAAWRNQAVLVDDIATDPLWDDFRHLISPLGYLGCWSTPIRNSKHQPIGTFALYFRHPRSPATRSFHQRLIDACTHLCALALERDREQKRVSHLAFYDGLTNLPNRALLCASTNQALRTTRKLAVMLADLDRFKQINETLGHKTGNRVLCHVAEMLRRIAEPGDIAGRLASDEFAIVVADCDGARAAERAGHLLSLLSKPFTIDGNRLMLSVSVGIALFPSDGRDMDILLNHANMAMAQAKATSRGQLRFFREDMNRQTRARMVLESALRDAIETERLTLSYQPQINVVTGHLHGIEALARWKHPQLGTISPADFIPMAEECGMIAPLGRWALNEACRQLALWRTQGLAVPSVSVNLSPTSFRDHGLTDEIAATLRRHHLSPDDLIVELTEGVLLDNDPITMKTVEAVRTLGVRLSMDDFGTGYSSLSYLRRIEVSELKVDKSFIADLDADPAARALSSAILGIGVSLGLTVVAEGVETPTQAALLKSQGYPVVQGVLFARPMPPDQLASWLASPPPTQQIETA